MTRISQRLEHIVRKELLQNPIPVRTTEGILVGDVLIQSQGHIKNLLRNDKILYKEIHLNAVAIKIANLLALGHGLLIVDRLYHADQDYGRWFVDSQMLRSQYQKAKDSGDYDRADILWARYSESRDRTIAAKNLADSLTKS
jgi:hypothetical protein